MARPITLGKVSIVVAAALGVAVALGLGGAESSVRASLQPISIEELKKQEAAALEGVDPVTGGGKLFAMKCNVCHPNAKSGFGPTLVGAEFTEKFPDDPTLSDYIRKGKGTMPGYKATLLSDQGLAAIIAYMRTLK